jgi:hypothetical protein
MTLLIQATVAVTQKNALAAAGVLLRCDFCGKPVPKGLCKVCDNDE